MDDDAIRDLVARLARPHPSGGTVIERAAILAGGGDPAAVLAWIADHDGVPETLAPRATSRGLHTARMHDEGGVDTREPRRYVLPPGVLT